MLADGGLKIKCTVYSEINLFKISEDIRKAVNITEIDTLIILSARLFTSRWSILIYRIINKYNSFYQELLKEWKYHKIRKEMK